jgi:hypothetical protein
VIKKFLIIILLIISVFLLFRIAFLSNIDADEIEHTHISWLINNGQLPYKDIHQIHMPLIWISTAPLLKILPESSYTFLFLRALTILFFFLTVWIGGKILKEVFKTSKNDYLLYYYLLTFFFAIPTEFYKFRPDPFMTFFAITGVFILLKYYDNKKIIALISGILFGISLSFSLKVLPLVSLFPLITYNKIKKGKIIDFIILNISHYLGLIIGLSPSFIWIFSKGIFRDFYQWVIINNFQMKNSLFFTKKHLFVFFVLVVIYLFLEKKYNKNHNHIFRILSLSFILSYSIRIIDPNHLMYNWQIFIIYLIIISLFLFYISNRLPKYTIFIIPIIVIIIIGISPIIDTLSLKTHGWEISPDGINLLISLKGDKKETCVGFSPYHPVFCKDATPLYLLWDYFFIPKDWVSEEGKEVYRKMWPQAIKDIINKKPKIIVAPRFFKLAYKRGIINQKQFILLYNFTKKYYQIKYIGKIIIFVRK